MRVIIKAAATLVVLMAASSALAVTPQSGPSRESLQGAAFLNNSPSIMRFNGQSGGLQSTMVGSGLRPDGQWEFSGEGASSVGYLTSAMPPGPPKAVRDFQDEIVTYRTPGVTTVYKVDPTEK